MSAKAGVDKSKRTAKASNTTPAVKVERLYRSLHDQLVGEFLPNALKTCDKILRIEAKDELALDTKAQLLIALERYDEAVELLARNEADDEVDIHRVYCLYKKGRLEEALSLLDQVDGDEDRTIMLLKAQTNYRLQRYEESKDLYEQLVATGEPDSPETADLEANLKACDDILDFIASVPSRLADDASIPLEKLESAPIGPALQSDPRYKVETVAQVHSDEQAEDAAIKRRNVKRLPKGLDPSTAPPPDPNRWIPKRRRPEFAEEIMRKRAQTRKGNKLATQGAAETSKPGIGGGGGASKGSSSSKNKKKGKKGKR